MNCNDVIVFVNQLIVDCKVVIASLKRLLEQLQVLLFLLLEAICECKLLSSTLTLSEIRVIFIVGHLMLLLIKVSVIVSVV